VTLSGDPFVITDAVGAYLTRAFFATANGGTIVFRTGETAGNRPEFVGRSGKTEAVLSVPWSVMDLMLSPDGRSIVANIQKGDGVNNVWVLDPARGAHTRLTLDDTSTTRPIWSPDGKHVAYIAGGLWIKPLNGSGKAERIADAATAAWSWSHDGKQLLVSAGTRPDSPGGLFLLALDGDRKPVSFVASKFSITQAQFSADDRWVAYVSDESGEPDVYVQRFAAAGERIRLSNSGGVQPRWRRDGRELFYVEATGKLMSVALRYGKTLEADAPAPLFDARLSSYTSGTSARYDVAPDGKHFWLSRLPDAQNTSPLRVILNWQGATK
jgi:dipeptidyl aminopeptidase/acylaminoacyl peptidase